MLHVVYLGPRQRELIDEDLGLIRHSEVVFDFLSLTGIFYQPSIINFISVIYDKKCNFLNNSSKHPFLNCPYSKTR